METITDETSQPKPKQKSKNRNTKEYIRQYMREKYKKDPKAHQKYQKSCVARRKYSIPDTFKESIGNDIHHIIKIHHLINELEPDSFNVYLSQFKDKMSFCETHNNTTD